MNVIPDRGMMTDAALAAALGVERATVHGWEADGFPVMRIGNTRLYDLAALKRWLKDRGRQRAA